MDELILLKHIEATKPLEQNIISLYYKYTKGKKGVISTRKTSENHILEIKNYSQELMDESAPYESQNPFIKITSIRNINHELKTIKLDISNDVSIIYDLDMHKNRLYLIGTKTHNLDLEKIKDLEINYVNITKNEVKKYLDYLL